MHTEANPALTDNLFIGFFSFGTWSSGHSTALLSEGTVSLSPPLGTPGWDLHPAGGEDEAGGDVAPAAASLPPTSNHGIH